MISYANKNKSIAHRYVKEICYGVILSEIKYIVTTTMSLATQQLTLDPNIIGSPTYWRDIFLCTIQTTWLLGGASVYC